MLQLIQEEKPTGVKADIIAGLQEIIAIREGKWKGTELKDFLAELSNGR